MTETVRDERGGPGKRLFGDGTIPRGLKLRETRTSTTGVIVATYEPAGAIARGSFAFAEPTDAERERRRRLALEDESAHAERGVARAPV